MLTTSPSTALSRMRSENLPRTCVAAVQAAGKIVTVMMNTKTFAARMREATRCSVTAAVAAATLAAAVTGDHGEILVRDH
eukprot:1308228-Rhodomonas_salina.1